MKTSRFATEVSFRNLIALVVLPLLCLIPEFLFAAEPLLRIALLRADQVTPRRIAELVDSHSTGVAIMLEASSSLPDETSMQERAEQVLAAKLELYYWIEVARCPTLADEHPKWMASQQTHAQWRRLFSNTPTPKQEEVVKTYPWVPILSRETFTAQLDRLKGLLEKVPPATGVFLNDLQGAPSACGCGNSQCRWTSDYGKRRSTVPLGFDAAALFIGEIQKMLPRTKVIPVWTTECEEHDGAKDGLCAGVGCFDGICWKSYTAQLAPVEQICPLLGVLATYKAFNRNSPLYDQQAGWIQHAVKSFETMPRKHRLAPIEASRLITVLQGWDVDASEIEAQVQIAELSHVRGYIIAYSKIEQGWEPRLVAWP